MTMAELLADLASRANVADVGSPVLQGGAAAVEDNHGYFLYNIPVLEIRGDVGATLQVTVKCKDYGGVDDHAYYMGGEPKPNTVISEFQKWMYAQYTADTTAYPGLIIHHIDEVAETAIISYFEDVSWARIFAFVDKNNVPNINVLPSFDLALLEYSIPVDGGRS